MLETTERLCPGLGFSLPAGDVRPRRLVMPGLAEGDRVQRPVQPTVAAAVGAHSLDLSSRRRDRCHTGEHGERGRRPEALDVAGLGHQSRGGQDSDCRQPEYRVTGDERRDRSLEVRDDAIVNRRAGAVTAARTSP